MRFKKNTNIAIILGMLSLLLFSCMGENDFPIPTIIEEIGNDNLAGQASNPIPADSTLGVFRDVTLYWHAEDIDGDSLTFEIFFSGNSDVTTMLKQDFSDTSFVYPSVLAPNSNYYWKVDILDSKGNWRFGEVWTFRTGPYRDNPPVLTFEAPEDGTEYNWEDEITFTGSATDIEDSTFTESAFVWTSSIDNEFGTGTTVTTNNLTPGQHTITLTVTDSKENSVEKSIEINILDTRAPNILPKATILSPETESIFNQGASIKFEGKGEDPEDGLLGDQSLNWTSSIDGDLSLGRTIETDALSLGIHTITLTATDGDEGTDTANIQIEIVVPDSANSAPNISIISPNNFESFIQGSQVVLSARGQDKEQGYIDESNFSWSSDKDGAIGTGSPIFVSLLSIGKHIISVETADQEGLTSTEFVTIFISDPNNTPPVARFLIEQIGTETPGNQPGNQVDVNLDASVVLDKEDEIAGIEVRWDFNNDGTWDTDFSLNKLESYSYISIGKPYFIKMEAIDPGGKSSIKTLIVPEIVFIPAGEFLYGYDSGNANELPRTTVNLDGYYIDKYEVTNEQFAIFMSENGYDEYYFTDMDIEKLPGGGYRAVSGKENYPVMFIDWNAASNYSAWLNKRLPSEAEWEKAARGGLYLDEAKTIPNPISNRIFPWGNTISIFNANVGYSGLPFTTSSPNGIFNGQVFSGITTLKSVSPYGIYDLSGNAAEWVNDYYDSGYYSTMPVQNPLGPVNGEFRVVRGGGFDTIPADARISKRSSAIPTARPYNVGFRTARDR